METRSKESEDGAPLSESFTASGDGGGLIAQTLARMHSVKLHKGGQVAPSLFPTLHKYLRLVPTHFDDIEKNLRFVSCIPSKAELELEVSLLEEHLSGLGSPVVFCHNDLLVKNIIYQEKQGRVIFIDFEYADNNYQALDIGNHFCEFGGVERFDSSLYPDREFQLCWLQHYLDEWHRLAGRGECASSRDVEVLYVQVNKFALREGSLVQKPSGFDCPLGSGDELLLVFQVFKDELGLPRFD
ncbi:hypothetical protein HPB51_002316 [Rhipicephalus microplus]|uniref:ethanolamine kinase n=1 Tax=Rhipicephalus microplus TaxID=6941 RepID=A0A9J6DS77_RHIMP|nr:hypothetical protein HPB51_002316 [Rhipicephalus microplus]